MQFELTEALISQILFSMEDQDLSHFLDTRNGVVVDAVEREEGTEDDRYESLPGWLSADGFRLMERFAAELKNPIVREELSSALERGRGVFRAFKNTLSLRPEVERLWFKYKDRAMRRAILDWYNGLCEEWGIDRIGEEPEETVDLVLEDFRFRPACEADKEAVIELYERSRRILGYNPSSSEPTETKIRGTESFNDFSSATTIVVENVQGELAGVAIATSGQVDTILKVLDVSPEYRGLGIGEALLIRLIEKLGNSGIRSIKIDLPASSEAFSRVLLREGFQPYEVRYRLDLPVD